MALYTRKQIRRLVCETDFGEITYGTATSGDLGYLIDTEKLRSSTLSPERVQSSWICLALVAVCQKALTAADHAAIAVLCRAFFGVT